MTGIKAGVDKQSVDELIAYRCVGRLGQVSREVETRHTHTHTHTQRQTGDVEDTRGEGS